MRMWPRQESPAEQTQRESDADVSASRDTHSFDSLHKLIATNFIMNPDFGTPLEPRVLDPSRRVRFNT